MPLIPALSELPWRARRVLRSFACVLACAALAISAHAADKPEEKPPAEEKPAAPAAIPLAEMSAQAEAALVNLREIATSVGGGAVLVAIEKDLPALTREIDVRLRENARIIAQRPGIELLRTVERSWRRASDTLDEWSGELEARIAAFDRDLARLGELDATWKATLAGAVKEEAPPELLQRAQAVSAASERTRSVVEAQRARALRLQSRIAAQTFRVSEAVSAVQQARDITLGRVFQRDSAALWSSALRSTAGNQITTDSAESREAQEDALQLYVQRNSGRMILHAAFFAALAGLLYWARRRINAWAEHEPALHRPALVFAWPVATALLLALIGSRWMYPEAPRLLWAMLGATAMIPTVLVLRRLIAPYLLPLLYAVVVLYFVDQVRAITASVALVPRIIFFAEMIGGAAFVAWYMRGLKRIAVEPGERPRTRTLLKLALGGACALFAFTALANLVGFLALANLLGNAVLRSMYFGLVLYALVEILDALVIMALRVRPLTLLRMVARHHELLRRRIRLILNALALALWGTFVLERLSLRERVFTAFWNAFTAELSIGSISMSLADVVAFGLAVWASFLVSRFVRFVLDEEIYPHAHLKRGLPYAISQTVHYLILVIGFFVAMAALGLDMTKFTILAGAFTVGVGFGLQNIFNNFVSGLILLYERPVQVGDVIQIDDAAGLVQRIGIRASIIRTPNGSEIIVPNGKLISDRLINWTFSDRQRGIEVAVSVVLQSDPERVIEIMERTAQNLPRLVAKPAPKALLTRTGPDWFGLELHAATDRIEDWLEVRSELAIALTKALVAEGITLR